MGTTGAQYRAMQEAADKQNALQNQLDSLQENLKMYKGGVDKNYNDYKSIVDTANARYSQIYDEGRQHRIKEDFGGYHTFFTYPINYRTDTRSFFRNLDALAKAGPMTRTDTVEDQNFLNTLAQDYKQYTGRNGLFNDTDLYNKIISNRNNQDFYKFFSLENGRLMLNTGDGLTPPSWIADIAANAMYDLASQKSQERYQSSLDYYNKLYASSQKKSNDIMQQSEEVNQEKASKDQSAVMAANQQTSGVSVAKDNTPNKNSVPILGGSGFDFGGMLLGFNDLLGSVGKNEKKLGA